MARHRARLERLDDHHRRAEYYRERLLDNLAIDAIRLRASLQSLPTKSLQPALDVISEYSRSNIKRVGTLESRMKDEVLQMFDCPYMRAARNNRTLDNNFTVPWGY